MIGPCPNKLNICLFPSFFRVSKIFIMNFLFLLMEVLYNSSPECVSPTRMANVVLKIPLNLMAKSHAHFINMQLQFHKPWPNYLILAKRPTQSPKWQHSLEEDSLFCEIVEGKHHWPTWLLDFTMATSPFYNWENHLIRTTGDNHVDHNENCTANQPELTTAYSKSLDN